MVRTQARPYGLCHRPYTKAHIKGFGSSYLHVYACLLLCFMLVLASIVLGFAMLNAFHRLDLVWLHPTPMRPCLDVTIWEASLDARLLRTYLSLSAPCDAMLTMFVCTTRWLSMHLCTLAHMSMHESCLLVCHPCFNTISYGRLIQTYICPSKTYLKFFLVKKYICIFIKYRSENFSLNTYLKKKISQKQIFIFINYWSGNFSGYKNGSVFLLNTNLKFFLKKFSSWIKTTDFELQRMN